jgi:type I restriction-modification system DNA methylase subunit
LGWDIFDTDEVSPEEKASKGRVDCAFKLNRVSRFYLEIKPLKASLANPNYIKQIVTYAYSKGVTWAALTNFQELRLFNAQANKAFITLSFRDYLTDFDRLWLLSRESLQNGLLDREAAKVGALPLGIPPIEKRLFEQLRQWREELFNQLLGYNENLKPTQIDQIIQRLYNRLIFIRTCEDRDIEEKTLLATINQWKTGGRRGDLIESIRNIFQHYDGYYDSELFAMHAADRVFIDSVMLESMITGLYQIKGGMASYDFSLIDADVLGAVYEQYLGHVALKVRERAQRQLKLGVTDDDTYKVIDKKLRRKEQGIYYTPKFVTQYAVDQTVGQFLKDHHSRGIADIRILDPACGSGSFLIRAYDALLNHHASEKGCTVVELGQTDRLPILRSSVFGVDLDIQAVEIARLNLLLRSLARRETLPTLADNIKQGNSLISGTPEELKQYFGRHYQKKIPFDWEGEFKETMARGGFDIVIGNPPYGADFDEQDRRYIEDHYPRSKDNKNSAMVFIERGLSLTKEGGYFSFIVPKSLAYSQKWLAARKHIAERLGCAYDTSKAFKEVLLEQMVIVVSQKYVHQQYYKAAFLDEAGSHDEVTISKGVSSAADTILLGITEEELKIFSKMTSSGVFLGRYVLRKNVETTPEDTLGYAAQKVAFLRQPKIMSQQIIAHVQKPTDHIILMSTLDKLGVLTLDTVQNTVLTDKNYDLELITALLNSTLWSWYAYRFIFSRAVRTMHFDGYYTGKFPLPQLVPTKSSDVKTSKTVSSLVDRMLEANAKMQSLPAECYDEKAELSAEIEEIDRAIDNTVYTLYGLSPSEIELITKGSSSAKASVL